MTDHQTQNERSTPTSRRALATGSSLLAVMILLSMLPPSAGLVAVSALGDDPARTTLRDVGGSTRREARTLRTHIRTRLAQAERTPFSVQPSTSLLRFAAVDAAPVTDRATSATPIRDMSPVRDALLALPPPRA